MGRVADYIGRTVSRSHIFHTSFHKMSAPSLTPPTYEKYPVGAFASLCDYAGKIGSYSSAAESSQYWRSHNELGESTLREHRINQDKFDGTEVVQTEQSSDLASVALVTIKDGGHTWPGADSFNVGLPVDTVLAVKQTQGRRHTAFRS